jgi:hypothetical protein
MMPKIGEFILEPHPVMLDKCAQLTRARPLASQITSGYVKERLFLQLPVCSILSSGK